GISVGWSWGYGRSGAHHNLIEQNHVHHLGYGVLSELSGIYTLGVSPGTRICNNLLHDTFDYKFGSWGIGLDEGTSETVVENNIVYRHGYGIGLHYGHENLIRNNIIALIRGHDLLGVGRVDGPTTMEVSGNLFYSNCGLITAKPWADGKILSDRNLFWDTTLQDQTDLAGNPLEDWQADYGTDLHSLVADPLFVDPERGDFRLKPGSPALKVGFQPLDLSSAGLYGEPEWTGLPDKVVHPDYTPELRAVERPLNSFADDFEGTAAGDPPKLATLSGQTGGASIRVSDEAAAAGKHSLKFTDAAGLEATWQPHLWYSPRLPRGYAELSFDVRLEAGAKLVVGWRDWRGAMLGGPHVELIAGGKAKAVGKDVCDVPPGKWLHVVMLSGVGALTEQGWKLTITPAGGKPVALTGLGMENDGFRQLTWIGFISDANGPAVSYVDNLRLRSGRTAEGMR
ncbi:MAG: right-handed parallel beta-helix repeat-containing protein, partial [Armatimonadetes bacterium]|nr:right-handed parallel beta-helix repeat-containing protein [Armatimonadota bacterium]